MYCMRTLQLYFGGLIGTATVHVQYSKFLQHTMYVQEQEFKINVSD